MPFTLSWIDHDSLWYRALDNLFHIRGKDCLMSRILFAVVTAAFVVGSLSGCGTIGKGKGKAPPPVVEEPAAAPVYK